MKKLGGDRDYRCLLFLAAMVISLFAITTLAQNDYTVEGTFRVQIKNNVPQILPNEILNLENNTVNVSCDLTTKYPVKEYRFLISKGSPTNPMPAANSGPRKNVTELSTGFVKINDSYTWRLRGGTGTPNGIYYAHIPFSSQQLGTVDAGVYERFTISDYAYFVAYKFNDYDADGVKDADEPLIFGWKFTIDDSKGHRYNATTGSDGGALIGPIPAGKYRITEDMKNSNWIATTPAVRESVDVLPFVETKAEFGNKLKDGFITIRKYYDYNGDGNPKGNLEPGIPGWKFAVEGGPQNKRYEILTNSDGKATLRLPTTEEGAVYTINESFPSDRWECTTPPIEKRVILRPEANESVDYGNRLKPATIGITKFRDYDGNGKRESNEQGLSWTFYVNGTEGSTDTPVTDRNGRLDYQVLFPMPSSLTSLPDRSFYISEITKLNWNQTTPLQRMPITVGPGSREDVPAFGNYLRQSFNISKYNDTNNNSIRDPGEKGVPGWKFLIEDSSGASIIKETDSQGNITVNAKPNTKYMVTEYLQPGWKPTTLTQQSQTTDAETPEFEPLMFGNTKEQKIVISKFEDTHNEGKRDVDELGIADWEFDVTGPVDSPKNNTVRVRTSENGEVKYLCPTAGHYIVKEVKKSGCWISTTNDTVPVYVPEGETVHIEFGNYEICHLSTTIALENPDVEVRKFVDPSQLTTDMIGACGDTYLNYTIQVRPRETAEATDLVIAMNDMVPRTADSQKTIDTTVNGVAGFLDEQARNSNPSSRIGLIRWVGTESNEIYPNANYTDLSDKVRNSQFLQTNTTSVFADWTLGIIDKFYIVSLPNTSKILVLVTDSESPIRRPSENLSANYTIYAIAIGEKETDATRFLGQLVSEHHGKLYFANDSAELQNALTKIAWVTRPNSLKDVQLIDTLPSYLEPVGYQVNPPDPKNVTENNDGIDWHTTTMKWWAGNLSSSGRPWNTSFIVRFCWTVPADVHQREVSPRVSQVNYVREDGSIGTIQVPEGAISIKKSALPATQRIPGFEALLSLSGLLISVYILRRK
jgi:hypothetical protein